MESNGMYRKLVTIHIPIPINSNHLLYFFLLSLKETKDVISWLQFFKIRHVVIRYLPVILIFSGGQRKEAFQDMGQFKEREEGTGGH